MKIFDFSIDDEMEGLLNNHEKVSQIKASLAEKRKDYREFCVSIELDHETLLTCCNEFEKLLVIHCFTFSERLLKNTIYELVDKDKHKNKHVNSFINNKIPDDKFSPSVKIVDIESELKTMFDNFKFIFNKNHEYSRSYNNLVAARHELAHGGSCTFNFEYYHDVIEVIRCLCFEYKTLILFRDSPIKRNEIQEGFLCIKDTIKKMRNSRNPRHLKIKYREIRDTFSKMNVLFRKKSLTILCEQMLLEINYLEDHLSELDFRKTPDYFLAKFDASELKKSTFMDLFRSSN